MSWLDPRGQMKRREFILLFAGAMVGGTLVTQPFMVHAQNTSGNYPDHPITLIVPYAPGGGNDVVARAVADPMSKTLGQPVVIEHRRRGRRLGRHASSRQAAPDGYTLGLGGTGTLAIDPTLYPNVGYDPRRDFAP